MHFCASVCECVCVCVCVRERGHESNTKVVCGSFGGGVYCQHVCDACGRLMHAHVCKSHRVFG